YALSGRPRREAASSLACGGGRPFFPPRGRAGCFRCSSPGRGHRRVAFRLGGRFAGLGGLFESAAGRAQASRWAINLAERPSIVLAATWPSPTCRQHLLGPSRVRWRRTDASCRLRGMVAPLDGVLAIASALVARGGCQSPPSSAEEVP